MISLICQTTKISLTGQMIFLDLDTLFPYLVKNFTVYRDIQLICAKGNYPVNSCNVSVTLSIHELQRDSQNTS